MQKYIVSNLVMENSIMGEGKKRQNEYSEEDVRGHKVCRVRISEDAGESMAGRYITVYTPPMWDMDGEGERQTAEVICRELKALIGGEISKGDTFLVAGVGNRQMAADSVGPLTLDGIRVTRHVQLVSPRAFEQSGLCSVCAVECGVLGDTGIRTLELLHGLVRTLSPRLVIAVDALAARSSERLGATVQISDTGISPGAGIGNRQMAINRQTLGVPVIAVGVPTVVSATTLIADALLEAGESKLSKKTEKALDGAKNFFVTPKECDLMARGAARILACGINQAFMV